MRKVLLATTALVALGGVSAASADVSLSASASWLYDSWSDDTAATTSTNNSLSESDADFTISGSTTADSGMTFGGTIAFDDTTDGDDSNMYISDDWGRIDMGEANDAAKSASAGNSAFDAAISGSTRLDTGVVSTGLSTATVVGDENANGLKYTAPTVNGLTLAVSQSDAGAASRADSTQVGLTYALDVDGIGITVHYATADTDSSADVATGTTSYETAQSGYGVKVVYGDFTVRAASRDTDYKQQGTSIGATGYEASTSDFGITYAMSDTLTVEAVSGSGELSANSADGADTLEATQIGVKYVPATGMYVSLTNRSYEFKDGSTTNDGANTRLKFGVTF